MIDIKQAVANAKTFARDVLGQDDLLLEEVSSDDDAFEITLSMPRRAGAPRGASPENSLIPRYMHAHLREFKSFRVLKQDGTVTKMSIREIA